MKTSFKATFLWSLGIRWLHDALVEEAFDKIERRFTDMQIQTKYNVWVKFLRGALTS